MKRKIQRKKSPVICSDSALHTYVVMEVQRELVQDTGFSTL